MISVEQTAQLTLKPGTVIHVCGWPVETVGEVVVQGHPGNIELIRRDLYLQPQSGIEPSAPPAQETPQ